MSKAIFGECLDNALVTIITFGSLVDFIMDFREQSTFTLILSLILSKPSSTFTLILSKPSSTLHIISLAMFEVALCENDVILYILHFKLVKPSDSGLLMDLKWVLSCLCVILFFILKIDVLSLPLSFSCSAELLSSIFQFSSKPHSEQKLYPVPTNT